MWTKKVLIEKIIIKCKISLKWPNFFLIKLLIVLKLNLLGVNLKKMLNFGYFKKWEKTHNKILKFELKILSICNCTVKFEVKHFEHLCLELIKNEIDPHLS